MDGNTVLSQKDIERAVYPFLGPDGTVEKVAGAARALEAVYREQGYPTVGVVVADQIQLQLTQGVARLEVFEQKVDRVRITGGRYFRNAQVRDAVPAVKPGSVLNAQALQRDLDELSRRSGDRSVRPVVKAGRAPGLLDVELQVEDTLPLHANLELNNFASANTSDLRLSATVEYRNLFQRQHSLSFNYQTAPENRSDVEVMSATYAHRPQTGRAVFSLTGVKSDSSVANLGDTTVLGKGEFLISRMILPLRTQGNFRDTLLFGVDYKNAEDTTNFLREIIEGVTGAEEDIRKIDYVNLHLGYELGHDFWGARNNYSIAANFGVRQFGNERAEFEEKRFKGEPNYLYMKLRARRNQPLWREGWLLGFDLSTQLTGDQLIGNEQMSIGGFNSVRGYLEAERLADYGFLSSVELLAPELANLPGAVRWQPYAFWDWGLGLLHEPLPDEDDRFSLASAGLGMRLYSSWGLSAEAIWAHALRDGTQTADSNDKISFRVSYGF